MDAQSFFRLLFPDLDTQDNVFAEIRTLSKAGNHQYFCATHAEILPVTADDMVDVYYGVVLREGRGGDADHARGVTALWADLDFKSHPQGKEGVVSVLQSFEFLPTVTVGSGNGYHPYWLLREPEHIETDAQATRIREIVYGIGMALGGDDVSDLPRILRVPDTKNHKSDPPKDVRIVSWHPERQYNLSDFERWRQTKPGSNGKPKADVIPDKILQHQRNVTLTSLAGTMRRRGMSEDGITVALLQENAIRCDPPLDEREVRGIAHSIMRYEPEEEHRDCVIVGGIKTFALTDLGNGERLVDRHGSDFRYCVARGCWLAWTGQKWKADADMDVRQRAFAVAREIPVEAGVAEDEKVSEKVMKWAKASETRSRIESMLYMAQPELRVPIEDLDTNGWLLNVQNGTLNLKTGELMPHRREDMITKICPVVYDPGVDYTEWSAFVDQIMVCRPALASFLRRAVGYGLTGVTIEQVFFILFGGGHNGKSTFLDVVRSMLGDYALHTPTKTLMEKRDAIPNDVARLRGARFVDAIETQKGRRLDEPLVKEVTGGDMVTARFLNQEFFEFRPEFKLFLAVNHKPQIRGTDHAIWRRVRLVPFDFKIPEKDIDKNLADRLKANLSGVLRWAVEGCLEWQRVGLAPPEEVTGATASYRIEMDTIGSFIDERCITAPLAQAVTGDLYAAYTDWCQHSGERPLSKKNFGIELLDRGYDEHRGTKGVRYRLGIELVDRPDYGHTPHTVDDDDSDGLSVGPEDF